VSDFVRIGKTDYIVQRKTQRPVQFALTAPTRSVVAAWIEAANLKAEDYLFRSRRATSPHVSTRQYVRLVIEWVAAFGLDSTVYGTHSMRRTQATLSDQRTTNLRAVQLLLGHSKLDYVPPGTMSLCTEPSGPAAVRRAGCGT